MIRKMDPYKAVEILSFTNNAAAQPLAKAIKTAIANAGKKEVLGFAKIEINEAAKLKRYRAGTAGRGRGRPYKKRWSHIKVVLTDDVSNADAQIAKIMNQVKAAGAQKAEKITEVIEGETVIDTKEEKGAKK